MRFPLRTHPDLIRPSGLRFPAAGCGATRRGSEEIGSRTRESSDSRLTSEVSRLQLRKQSQPRRGAVVVEMALIVPFLVLVLLGICELGQALRVHSFLSEASRQGGAAGSQPGNNNADVIEDVKTALSAFKLNTDAAVITIKVNDAVGNVAQAKRNDKITVTVAMPMSAAAWTGSSIFVSSGSIRSETTVMLRQG